MSGSIGYPGLHRQRFPHLQPGPAMPGPAAPPSPASVMMTQQAQQQALANALAQRASLGQGLGGGLSPGYAAPVGAGVGTGMPPGFAPSDRRMKTDEREVGKLMLPGGEVPLKTFRFQGDPVRRMGLVAQDVEKVDPSAVYTHPVTGMKGLNYARVLLGAHHHAMNGGGSTRRAGSS